MGDIENINERRHETRREADRSLWGDPKLWLGVIVLVVGILSSLVGYMISQLATLNSTQTALLVSITEQKGKVDALTERIDRMQNQVDTIEKAYQYNVGNRLAYLEAKTGYKAPPQPQPQE